MNVFTYGSLMFADVWQAVVKGDYRSSTGQVHGFVRRCVKKQTYPGAIRGGRHDVLAGRVYFDVDSLDLNRLDRSEGSYYRRQTVAVVLGEGVRVGAQLYLFKDEYKDLLETRDWDVAWFEREGMARFLGAYVGFDRR